MKKIAIIIERTDDPKEKISIDHAAAQLDSLCDSIIQNRSQI